MRLIEALCWGSLGVGLSLISTSRYGLGVSPDSVSYLAASDSLVAGAGFLDSDGSPFSRWPPGFPLLLAAVQQLTSAPVLMLRVWNALLFGAVVGIANAWLGSTLRSATIRISGTTAVLTSGSLLLVSSFLWTEICFIIVSLCAFWLSSRQRSEGGRTVMLALLCALALSLRYAGIAVVVASAASWLERSRSKRDRRRLICALALSCVPTGAWMLWAAAHGATVAVLSTPAVGQMLDAFRRLGARVMETVLPPIHGVNEPATNVDLLSACVLVLWLGVRAWPGKGNQAAPFADGRTLATFGLSYIVVLIVASVGLSIDPIERRLIAPLVVPTVLLGCWEFERIWSAHGWMRRPLIGLGLATLWGLVVINNAVGQVGRSAAFGAGGLSQRSWRESPMVGALAQIGSATTPLTNKPYALYFFTRRRSAQASRVITATSGCAALAAAVGRGGDGSLTVVDFRLGEAGTSAPIQVGTGWRRISTVYEGKDGTIVRLVPDC